MTEAERIMKLGELLQNEGVVQQLSCADNKKTMQAVLENNGLQMSMDEVETFVRAMKLSCSDELDETELELATGGSADTLCALNRAFKGIINDGKHHWNAEPWTAVFARV